MAKQILLTLVCIIFYLHFAYSEEIECIQCSSFVNFVPNPDCTADGQIAIDVKDITVDCEDLCYYRTVANNTNWVTRGCTTNLKELPAKLPVSDCYNWEGGIFCVCTTPWCNSKLIGNSTGKSLDYLVETTTNVPATANPRADSNLSIMCVDCRNYLDGSFYDWCPKNGSVLMSQAHTGECKGPCFTRNDNLDSKLVVRGCTATQGNMPSLLPSQGCYDWNGVTVCVCSTPNCNKEPLGSSSGIPLDIYSTDVEPGSSDGPLVCFDCMNYKVDGTSVPDCPKDGQVNTQTVYRGNCTGACFTRTFSDNSTKVARGCTASQYGIPYPLPPRGCYSWNHETWCICNSSYCNKDKIGISNGIEMDDHLYNQGYDVVEPDGVHKCYECLSYVENVYYPQCPKDSRVKNAFLSPCNGTCFTRTFDKDDRIVARGCSTTQWGLPNPLPPDGCYTYYTEVWCVCSKSRCNGAALGIPQNIEFDAHIHNSNRGGHPGSKERMFILPILAIACLLRKCLVI